MYNHETKPSYEKKEVNKKIKLIDIMSRLRILTKIQILLKFQSVNYFAYDFSLGIINKKNNTI
jgi:hypothetical protein